MFVSKTHLLVLIFYLKTYLERQSQRISCRHSPVVVCVSSLPHSRQLTDWPASSSDGQSSSEGFVPLVACLKFSVCNADAAAGWLHKGELIGRESHVANSDFELQMYYRDKSVLWSQVNVSKGKLTWQEVWRDCFCFKSYSITFPACCHFCEHVTVVVSLTVTVLTQFKRCLMKLFDWKLSTINKYDIAQTVQSLLLFIFHYWTPASAPPTSLHLAVNFSICIHCFN